MLCFNKPIKRFLSAIMSIALLIGICLSASAAEVPIIGSSELNESGQSQTVPVTLDAEEVQFSVTVPSGLPIYIDRYSQVYVAEGAKVVNNSGGPVAISDFEIKANGEYTLVDYDSFDINDYQFGDKKAAIRIGSVKTTGPDSTDFDAGSFNIMSKYDENEKTNTVEFSYDAKIPAVNEVVNTSIATVTFVLGWASGALPTGYVIQVPEGISNIKGVYQIKNGESHQLSVVEDYDTSVGEWSSSNPEVISVDSSTGQITANGIGTCTVYYEKNGLRGSALFNVDVAEGVTPVRLSIAENPKYKIYYEGDDFNPEGLVLNLEYSDGNSKKISEGYSIINGNSLSSSTSKVSVSYAYDGGTVQCDVPITVGHIEDYYVFEEDSVNSGFKVSVVPEFKSQITKWSGGSYKGWNSGEALPELPSTYQDKPVTSLSNMFHGFIMVSSLDLSRFDTSNVVDMSSMFDSSSALMSIDLSSFDTSKVKNMESMFATCQSLESLDLHNFDTANVTNMKRMFSGCKYLESIDLSSFITSNVTDMNSMFSGCGSVDTILLGNFDTSSVVDMAAMFSFCKKLTNVDLKSFNTSKVTNMRAMFNNCRVLTDLDLSSFTFEQVSDVTSIFSFCTGLTVKVPNGTLESKISAGDESYAGNVTFEVVG